MGDDDGDPSAAAAATADAEGGGGGGGGGLVTRSSLAMRGGLIRPPADNVRLVCDPQLQPGIPSIETRDVRRDRVGADRLCRFFDGPLF
jgi:hypothetical protein